MSNRNKLRILLLSVFAFFILASLESKIPLFLYLALILIFILYFYFHKNKNKNININLDSLAIDESLLIKRREIAVQKMSKELLNKLDEFPNENISCVAKETGFFNIDFDESMIGMKRTDGKTLTIQEKKELNLNPKHKYGWDYINILTAKGLENAYDALKTIYTISNYRKYIKNEFIDFSIIDDTSMRYKLEGIDECNACSSLKNKKYRLNELPVLPLKECNKRCLCRYKPLL